MALRFDWSKLVPIARAVYEAFLKGRTVRLPGGGSVVLPSERPGAALGGRGEPFDVPHEPGPTTMRPLLSASQVKELEGRSTPLYGPTVGILFLIVFGLPALGLILAGVWEAKTLRSPLKGDHITAQLRALFFRAPGAVFLALLVWWGLLIAVVFGVLAHAWF